MTHKKVKAVCTVICIFGLLLVLGTAGASDHELLPGWRAFAQTVVGVAMFCIGYAGESTR